MLADVTADFLFLRS